MSAVGDVITYERRLVVVQRVTRFAAFLFDLVEQPDDSAIERARYGVICVEPDKVASHRPVDPATLSDANRRFIAETMAGGLPYRQTRGRLTSPKPSRRFSRRDPVGDVDSPSTGPEPAPAARPEASGVNLGPPTLAALSAPLGEASIGDVDLPSAGPEPAPAGHLPSRSRRKKRVVFAFQLTTAAPPEAIRAACAELFAT